MSRRISLGDLVTLPGIQNPPSGPWQRQPILSDSLLPPALQRTNPSVRQVVYRPNYYDMVLNRKSQLWSWIRMHGGLKSCCRVPDLGAPIWDKPPWMVMPDNAQYFSEMFFQPLSAFQTGGNFNGEDTIIAQFVTPNGWDGVLNRVVFGFNGQGHVDGSGDIVWRVKVGVRYVRNLGNVTNTFGDFATAFSVPGWDNIRLVSQQTITFYANIPSGSPVNSGNVSAGGFGWFYPRR